MPVPPVPSEVGIGSLIAAGAIGLFFLLAAPALAAVRLGTRQAFAALTLSAAAMLALGLTGYSEIALGHLPADSLTGYSTLAYLFCRPMPLEDLVKRLSCAELAGAADTIEAVA